MQELTQAANRYNFTNLCQAEKAYNEPLNLQKKICVQLISKIMPAGNVPGMILSGLSRLPGRRIPIQKLKQDVNALFSGVEQVLDKAVYGAFFAGPAAVLWGYQNLLRLAGKDPESRLWI